MQRTEQQVFEELGALCRSPGYAHVIAHLCFEDNVIRYADEVTPEDMAHVSSMEHLSRSELSTLTGLMAKGPVDYSLPSPDLMQEYIDRTKASLQELHEVIAMGSFRMDQWKSIAEGGSDPFQHGRAFREPIFYGGESAYDFQYRDFALRKYALDDPWLEANRGFRIRDAQSVVRAVSALHNDKLNGVLMGMQELPPEECVLAGVCLHERGGGRQSGDGLDSGREDSGGFYAARYLAQ